MHPGGANITFGDDSVDFHKSSINPTPWRAGHPGVREGIFANSY